VKNDKETSQDCRSFTHHSSLITLHLLFTRQG
jgi:hypothetical protein